MKQIMFFVCIESDKMKHHRMQMVNPKENVSQQFFEWLEEMVANIESVNKTNAVIVNCSIFSL